MLYCHPLDSVILLVNRIVTSTSSRSDLHPIPLRKQEGKGEMSWGWQGILTLGGFELQA